MADNRFYFYMGVKNDGVHQAFEQATKDQEKYNSAAKRSEGAGGFGKTKEGLDRASQGFRSLGASMALTRNEALTLNYTINDVIASLASGASPMTILLQQGGQVQQVFGTLGNFMTKLIPQLIRFSPAIAAVGVAFAGLHGISVGEQAGKDFNELRIKADQAKVSIKTLQDVLNQGAGENVNMDKVAAGFERLRDSALAARKAQKETTDERDKALKDAGPLNSTAPDYASKIQAIDDKFKNKDIFSKLHISLAGFKGTAEEIPALAQRVASAIDRIGNEYKRAELEREAEQAFGEDFVRVLRNASSETEAFAKTYKDFLSGFDPDNAAKAAKSQQTAADHLAQLRKKVSDAESSAFIPAAQAKDDFMTQFLLRNETAIQHYIDFLGGISQTIQDFFGILQGDKNAAKSSPLIAEAVKGVNEVIRIFSSATQPLRDFYKALNGDERISQGFRLLETSIVASVKVIYNSVKGVTQSLNDFFGTNFSTESVIAGAALLKVISPLKTIRALLLTIAATNPFVILAAGAALLTMYSDKIDAGFSTWGVTIANNVIGGLRKAYLWAKMIYEVSHGKIAEASQTNQQLDDLEKTQAALDKFAEDNKKKNEENDPFKNMTFEEAFMKRLEGLGPKINDFMKKSFGVDTKSIWDEFGKNGEQELDRIGNKAEETGKKIKGMYSGLEGRENEKWAKAVHAPGSGEGLAGREDEKWARSAHVPGAQQGAGGFNGLAGREDEKWARAAHVPEDYTKNAEVQSENARRMATAQVTIRNPKNLQEGDRYNLHRDEPGWEGIDRVVPFQGEKKPMQMDTSGLPDRFSDTNNKVKEGASLWSQYTDAVKSVDQALVGVKGKISEFTDNQKKDLQKSAPNDNQAKQPAQQQQPQADPQTERVKKSLQEIQTLAQTASSAIGGFGVTVMQQVEAVAQQVRQTLTELTTAAENLKSSMPTPGSGSGGAKLASGGLIRGPGTSRSDNLLAWLSPGEFVMSAAAVSSIGAGVLAGMNAGTLSAPGFADGGVVGGYNPPGGLSSITGAESDRSSAHLTLVIDNKPHGPFKGPSADVDALSRSAIASYVGRTSKVPSRVG